MARKKKKKTFDAENVLKFMARVGRPLTLREICRHFGLGKQKEKVKVLLQELEKKVRSFRSAVKGMDSRRR